MGQGLAVWAARPWTPSAARSRLVLGAPGSLVGDVRDLRTRGLGVPMTIGAAPAGSSPEAPPEAPALDSPAPAGWPWRRAALFLAGAAQLITISALGGCRSRPSGLVVAAAGGCARAAGSYAAFAPAPVNLLAADAGIAAQATHTGLLFAPALVVLAVAADGLWPEQA